MKVNPDYWLFKKHKDNIEVTEYDYKAFRQTVHSKSNFKLGTSETVENVIFDWEKITPCYSFYFDYIGGKEEIKEWLKRSELVKHKNVYVELVANEPVISVSTSYFIENWLEFIDANLGMGSFVITEDMQLLMEFTDDAKYLLYSNFKIKGQPLG